MSEKGAKEKQLQALQNKLQAFNPMPDLDAMQTEIDTTKDMILSSKLDLQENRLIQQEARKLALETKDLQRKREAQKREAEAHEKNMKDNNYRIEQEFMQMMIGHKDSLVKHGIADTPIYEKLKQVFPIVSNLATFEKEYKEATSQKAKKKLMEEVGEFWSKWQGEAAQQSESSK